MRGGLRWSTGAALQFGHADAVAGADCRRKGWEVALGNPGAGLLQAKKLRPVIIDAELARLRATLQPFVSAPEIERRFRVDSPECRRSAWERNVLCCQMASRTRGSANSSSTAVTPPMNSAIGFLKIRQDTELGGNSAGSPCGIKKSI
ncbi:hypothetical protein NKI97_34485 [Mesorhizobium sp. M0296]